MGLLWRQWSYYSVREVIIVLVKFLWSQFRAFRDLKFSSICSKLGSFIVLLWGSRFIVLLLVPSSYDCLVLDIEKAFIFQRFPSSSC